MVVIDSSILMLLLRPDQGVPVGRDGTPISHPAKRIKYLVEKLDKAKVKIIIPTPVLSEVLVRADVRAAQDFVERISRHQKFRIEPFDQRAAIELAAMTRNVLDGGLRPSRRDQSATWAKLKFDRQIVAIAAVCQATTIYSDDEDIRKIAKRVEIQVVGLGDLELPPEDLQRRLPFSGEDVDDVG